MPKSHPAHNKGLTNIERYGPERAAEISKKESEAKAGKPSNFPKGSSQTAAAKEKNRLAHLGKISPKKGKSVFEYYGLEKGTEYLRKKSESAKNSDAIKTSAKTRYGPDFIPKSDERDLAGEEIVKFRIGVFERDSYTCQSCRAIGFSLNAHHILHWNTFPAFRFDVNNGITLCVYCHRRVHAAIRMFVRFMKEIKNLKLNEDEGKYENT